MTEQLPDERPQRRREYSGASSTLGVAMLIVVAVGVALWFFEFRDGGSSNGASTSGLGVVELPAGLNPTAKAPAAEPGRAAPNFRLQSPDGGVSTLDSFRGKYVLLNFWASWCGPCRGETPDLQALSERQSAKLTVLGVNQQEDAAAAKQFMAQFNLSYPIVLDSSGDVSQAYRVSGLPMSFLIDPDGVVKKIYVGRISSDDLRKIEAEEIS